MVEQPGREQRDTDNMLTTCSPTCSPTGDGTILIQLHSPTRVSQHDHFSAIKEIRRSLSRSPSKASDLRQHSSRSSPAKGAIPFSPSPLSPSRRALTDHSLHPTSFSSPHGNRLNPASRVHRPPLRRTVPGFSVTRTRTSPKSPTKRILMDLSDSGNASPILRKRNSSDEDEDIAMEEKDPSDNKENPVASGTDTMVWKSSTSKQEKRRSASYLTDILPLSPMKRSDGPHRDVQQEGESPSVKRRSLHAPLAHSPLDFSIFDSDSLKVVNDERRAQDDNDWYRPSSPLAANRFSTIPKRSSSLRKSTLQQRHPEKSGNDIKFCDFSPSSSPEEEMAMASRSGKTQPAPVDDGLPSPRRHNEVSSPPRSSLNHSNPPTSESEYTQAQRRHPLSRTVTQSSSTPSIQDDSPTHEPTRRPERPKSYDFSKSLPVGAMRPLGSDEPGDLSSQGSFATPANFKAARPLPAAFLSTGLISKKNRNAEGPDAGLPKAHMPDTPCKRQSVIFDSTKKFRSTQNVFAPRESYGPPATPREAGFAVSRVNPLPWGRSSIFGNRGSKPTLSRYDSFTSIESEEKTASQSPPAQEPSQSTDTDFPPTPTKHVHPELLNPGKMSPSSHGSAHRSSLSIPETTEASRFTNSKSSPMKASPGNPQDDSDGGTGESPLMSLGPEPLLKVLAQPSTSFTRSRVLRNLNSPTPLSRKSLFAPIYPSPIVNRTKMPSLSPVTPKLETNYHWSPHTPQDGFFPPDPSGLSISGKSERPLAGHRNSFHAVVPATPTGPREYLANFSNRPSLNLNAPDIADVDQSLTSKFDKVELFGTGEFSQVYRVSQYPAASPFAKPFSVTASRPTSRTSLPEHVWAVKKARYPYTGPKDRQKKIHEVDVLKALGHHEHIVAFVDSWEDKSHLYIQTEFCEEGTLDIFLSQVGLKARLDDFRIWKILLELSQGLRHIHESGFIHLDMKPANIFITFDGSLKIGDFGMASKWPAGAGIEGEGDREYIGPEILMGKYDKPADIFALGLIMLETAGNVELPDNGLSWQKLRQGDMSDVPSLTWSSDNSNILRDASGNPVDDMDQVQAAAETGQDVTGRAVVRDGELTQAPSFMTDPSDEQALDRLVRWMISPEPRDRPVVQQLLQAHGVQFVEARRRAGATIFEGNWGPADEIIAEDAEMIDV